MKIPNAERVEVDLRKFVEYCLSTTLSVGKHKAVGFRSALGLTQVDSLRLRAWLLQAAVKFVAVKERSDKYEDRYRIDFEVVTISGQATVRSAWIIRSGEDIPCLTTCFVLPS